MNTRDYIRMPPDGAGKALTTGHIVSVQYSSGNNTSAIQVGVPVEGSTSLVKGIVVRHIPDTVASGDVAILLDDGFQYDSFTVGETLTFNGGIADSIVITQASLHTNTTQLVSGDNPFHAQRVDNRGAANIRFAEGAGQFDAFGNLQTTSNKSLGSYIHQYDDLPFAFSNHVEGNATGFYDNDKAAYFLRCTTDPLDRIFRGTNKYHQYHPGSSQYIKLTCGVGDAGKTNVVRRWGYYDDENGVFFELHEQTLYVVLRKNMGNGVVEERVPQSDWSEDSLDGMGLSQVLVDVDKNNLWWMDLAYLGGGRVRMGLFAPDGSRVTAHIFENSNKFDFSYMRTGALPVSFEQFNIGPTGSISEMNVQAASVDQEQSLHPMHAHFGQDLGNTIVSGPDYIHLASFRSKTTYGGRPNRVVSLPDAIDVLAKDTTTGEDKNVRIAIAFNPDITGATWSPVFDSYSALEVSENTSSSLSGSDRVTYVGITYPGKTFKVDHLFPYAGDQFIIQNFDGDRPHISLYAKVVDPTDEVQITGDFRWREYP